MKLWGWLFLRSKKQDYGQWTGRIVTSKRKMNQQLHTNRGKNIASTLFVSLLFLLSLHQMLPLMKSFPVSPIVLFLLLLPLLIWCLSLCRPRFSCRMSALLYLPTIIFGLGAVLPFDFQWELRLPLAVLSVLSALVAVHLTRRRTMSPNKKAAEHAI